MSVFNITFKLHEIHPNISMCFLKLKGTAENKEVANIDYNFRAAFEGGMQEQNFEKKLLDVILPNN